MQVRHVSAAHGWRWVAGGFRLLASRPLALLSLMIFDLFVLLLPATLPVIGSFMPTVLTPVFTVGLMVAMRAADRGAYPMPHMILAAFGEAGGRAWRSLLVLGVVNAVATLAAVALASLADGGSLFGSVTGLEHADGTGVPAAGNGASDAHEGPVMPELSLALVVFLLLLVPIQAASWYAPLFIAWHRIPVAKSLFFSLVAVWRNRAAFSAYVLSWAAVALAISGIAAMLLPGLVQGNSISSMLLFFISVALLSAMYGSIWLSYRDVIEAAEPEARAISAE